MVKKKSGLQILLPAFASTYKLLSLGRPFGLKNLTPSSANKLLFLTLSCHSQNWEYLSKSPNPGRENPHQPGRTQSPLYRPRLPTPGERPHGRLGAACRAKPEAAPAPGSALLSRRAPGASVPGSPRHAQPPSPEPTSSSGATRRARARWNSQWPHTDLSFYRTGGPEATPGSGSFWPPKQQFLLACERSLQHRPHALSV